MTGIKAFFYDLLSKTMHLAFGKQGAKGFFELLYWRIRKLTDSKLSNHHYEYFYTTHFGLDKAFYSSKKIIDIGCGPRGSLEWADNTQERYGLDPLADSYKKLGAKNHKMQYVNSGSENIPFKDAYFDVVTTFNSLDHVDNLEKTISEIKRILKPSGTLLLITDIHDNPTVCEPSTFGWDILEKFKPEFEVQNEEHFERKQIYASLRERIAFDHSNSKERYGLLSATLLKV